MSTQGNSPKERDEHHLEVVLERRERSYAFGEPRVSRLATVDVADADVSAKGIQQRMGDISALEDDQKAVRALIEAFESLPPDQVSDSRGKLTTDPYISIAEGEMTSVDRHVMERWAGSNVFKAVSTAFQGPVEIVKFNAELIDERTAAATYTIEQSGLSGTSAAILVKGDDGQWRIAVHCQHPIVG